MLDNNLVFSLLLSLINTGIFIAMTHKDNFDQKKQEYLMLFGVTFITSFLLKTCLNKNMLSVKPQEIVSKSYRAPF
tara:strand:+ start:267 stop:494 length:228 start_codon:yes stop_codon:yes gene_type:complete